MSKIENITIPAPFVRHMEEVSDLDCFFNSKPSSPRKFSIHFSYGCEKFEHDTGEYGQAGYDLYSEHWGTVEFKPLKFVPMPKPYMDRVIYTELRTDPSGKQTKSLVKTITHQGFLKLKNKWNNVEKVKP